MGNGYVPKTVTSTLSLLMNSEGYDFGGLRSRTSNNLNAAFAKIKMHCPKLLEWLEGVYDNKIRNAVGHSDFYIIDREGIQFLDDNQPYEYVIMDDWNNIFSNRLGSKMQ